MTEPYYLGVDLGGTQLRMAAVTSAGKLASSMFSVPTGKEFSPESLRENLQALAGKVRTEIGEQVIAAIGMGIDCTRTPAGVYSSTKTAVATPERAAVPIT